MNSSFSAFVTIIPFEDLQLQFNLIPKTWKMYVKCEMESPGTRKCVFIIPKRISIEHAEQVIHLAIEICGTSCNNGHARHMLRTKYIRWRNWMSENDYFKLSEKLRKRSKFLNKPWTPDPHNPNRVSSSSLFN